MFETELDNLLQKEWSDEERAMITRLMENVTYYKKLIPKSLKQDIMNALQMCNVLKDELQYYREICKCKLETDVEQCKCKLETEVEQCKCKLETEVEQSECEQPKCA
jgi:hypothetical protein